jgi:chromosome segregation ATPase
MEFGETSNYPGGTMKRWSAVLLMTMTIAAMASHDEFETKVKCGPYKQALQHAEDELATINAPFQNLMDKQQKIQAQYEAKMVTLHPYIKQKEQLEQVVFTIEKDMKNLRRDKRSLKSEIDLIDQEISMMLLEIQNLERGMGRNNRRATMRQIMRNKKMIESKEAIKVATTDEISRIQQTIGELNDTKSQTLSTIGSVTTTIAEVSEQRPRLSRIQRNLEKVEDDLSHLTTQKMILEDAWLLASQEFDMCKTYKVKYPFGLKVMKRLYNQGCGRYTSIANGKKYREIAEQEILASVCQ